MHQSEPHWWDEDDRRDIIRTTRWFHVLMRHALEVRRIKVILHPEERGALFVTGDWPAEDPTIIIPSNDWDTIPSDIIGTCTLAHELGHHESFLTGEYTDELISLAASDDLYERPDRVDRALREAMLEEERRAWRYGREIAASLLADFPFDVFDRERNKSIEGYRRGYRL